MVNFFHRRRIFAALRKRLARFEAAVSCPETLRFFGQTGRFQAALILQHTAKIGREPPQRTYLAGAFAVKDNIVCVGVNSGLVVAKY